MKNLILCLSLLGTSAFAYENYTPNRSLSINEFFAVDHQDDANLRRWMCVAESGRGMRERRFVGVGVNRRVARRNAMRKCRRQSLRPHTCRIQNCRPVRVAFSEPVSGSLD